MTMGKIRRRERCRMKEHNEQEPTNDNEEPMEVGTIKVVETRNESVDEIDEIELIGETYNKNMDAKTDGESRIGETEYDEFTAELNTADSRDEHIKDAEKETDEQG